MEGNQLFLWKLLDKEKESFILFSYMNDVTEPPDSNKGEPMFIKVPQWMGW